jgi:elongation factor G
MKVYETANIRNIVLVGHQGAGKTSVSEAMLFASGAIGRLGSIADKSTVSDYHDTEHQRGMSIFASLLHVEHEGNKVNVIDTPGYPDFAGEIVASLKVADTAVFVLNATDPIQVGTDVAWGYATKAEIPVLFLVNHIDKPGVDFSAVIEKVQERFGRAATVLQFPAGGRGIVDLLAMKQLTFPEGKGKPTVGDIDSGEQSRAESLKNTLVENVAENDEKLMEKYLEAGELTADELMAGLRSAIKARQIFPVIAASATNLVGISRALDVVNAICPSPSDGRSVKTEKGEPFPVKPGGEPLAFCYRTLSEQHVGEFSFLKVYSGTLETGMDLENAQKQTTERLGSLFLLNGKNREAVPKLCAGDLGATVKLKDTHTNTTLHVKGSNVAIEAIEFPEPRYKAAMRPITAGEEDKLSTGLHKIVAEDPSLKIYHDALLSQMMIGGLGEMHIEIVKTRLKTRFGVDVELSVPKVSYRETILKSGRSSYRHKKQTGGAGQFADISMIVEPLLGEYQAPADIKVRGSTTYTTEWGTKLEMIDAIVSGVIDMKRFASAIQKGILETMRHGPLAGYPCGDIRVVVFDGKMHAVDSNENAFKTASRQCFKLAFQEASPVLLEPICELNVFMPDEFTGDVMGDLNTRRARVQGMEAEGAVQKITAIAPEVELLRYSTQLRSLTQGRGLHTAKFMKYEPMPRNVQEKVVAETAKAKEEED